MPSLFSGLSIVRCFVSVRSASALLCLALPALLHTRAQAQYTISALAFDPAFGNANNVNVVNARGQFAGSDGGSNVLLSGPHGMGAANPGMLDPFYNGYPVISINSSGQIAGGGYLNADGGDHAYIGGSNGLVDIGTLADMQDPGNGPYNSTAYGINNRGQVVGDSDAVPDPTIYSSGRTHAFLYDNGVLTDISSLPGNVLGGADFITSAFAINDQELIVGSGDTPVGGGTETHAFAYQNGVYHTLGTLNNTVYSSAQGVTNSGLIYGVSTYAPGDTNNMHAFLHSGFGLLMSSDDVGTFGGANSNIGSVNDAGYATGLAEDVTGAFLPYLYRNHTLTNLNDFVVGTGWTINSTFLITNDNSIYGEGIDPNGYESLFLLTPNAVPAAVPEPGALALLVGAGLSTVGLLTRKRRGRNQVAA